MPSTMPRIMESRKFIYKIKNKISKINRRIALVIASLFYFLFLIFDISVNTAHQLFDRFQEQKQDKGSGHCSDRDRAEKLGKWKAFEKSGKPACDDIADRNGEKPDSHHQSNHSMGCKFRHDAHTNRPQTKFTSNGQKINSHKPQSTHADVCAALSD